MKSGQAHFLKGAGAVFCAAMMLIFMQAAAASIVGKLQHAVVGQHDHHHMMFADITLDAAQHDADHDHHMDGQFHDDGAPADHGPSHHHHHGDLGASSLMLTSVPSGPLQAWSETVVPVRGRLLADARHSLPDRPPRSALLRV